MGARCRTRSGVAAERSPRRLRHFVKTTCPPPIRESTCGANASCSGGACYCNACFDETRPDGVLACTARSCGVNEACDVVDDQCKCRTGHHVHDGLAGCHSEGTVHAWPADQHTHETTGCDHTHGCPPRASLTTHDETTATCTCDEGDSDDPDQTGLQCVADAGSCVADQVGAPPDCTDCGRHRVPNAAGTACEACPEGQEEGFPGQCMPVGNCTRLGSYWPDAESGCVRAGLVLSNGSCRSNCRANGADNGWGVCVCDPGHVYTVAAGAIFGPTNCVRRTDELCGAAPDPGNCEPGGTWNSATARCDCGDGYERSEDGRSCVCADDGAEQTGTGRASGSPTRSRCSTACGSASSTPRRAT